MTTKLEMMVGYLAGRQGKAAESIRRELEDPTSEASRWLEEVQKRSRAVSRAALPKVHELVSPAASGNGVSTRLLGKKRSLPFLSGVSAASLVFIALGFAWRAQDNRLLRLETMLTEREARWVDRFDRLGEALTPKKPAPRTSIPDSKQSVSPEAKRPATVDGSTALALARIEARLGEVGERLREARSTQNQSDPRIDELRGEVERLRNELETRAQASRQENQRLSLIVQEVLQLLRQLAMRPWGPGPLQVPCRSRYKNTSGVAARERDSCPGWDPCRGRARCLIRITPSWTRSRVTGNVALKAIPEVTWAPGCRGPAVRDRELRTDRRLTSNDAAK